MKIVQHVQKKEKLMNKNYKILWSSFLISNVGDWFRKIALPFLVFEKTGSAFHMASLYGISFIPWIVFSIFGGVLADRYKKNMVIAYSHFISLVFLAILIIEFNSTPLNMMVIYVLTFLLSSTEPIVHPSFNSLIPQIVDKEKLANANSGMQLIDNTLNLVGPLIGGSILLIVNPSQVLKINVYCRDTSVVYSYK